MAPFTALNGNDSQMTEKPSNSPVSKSVENEERIVPAPSQEQRTSDEAASHHREHWSGPSTERGRPYHAVDYPAATYEGPPKRKRSTSAEPPRDDQSPPDERSSTHHRQDSRDAYAAQPRDRERRLYVDEGREDSWFHHSQSQSQREGRGAYDRHHSAGSMPPQNEDQSGDGQGTADSQDYSPTSPDDGDDSAYYGNSFATDSQRRDGIVQSDPKKRKRNFSNRTKTGCLTCRGRKKKCDEQKPECKFLPK